MELVVAGLVEPGAFEVEEGQAGHQAREGERVNRELRDGLVRASVGLVVEDMDRTIAHLQEIDVAGDESGLMTKHRTGAVDRFLGHDRDAVGLLKRCDIFFEEKNRNFHGEGRAVVDQDESLKSRMAIVVGADARNDQGCRVGRGVLLFDNGQAIKVKKVSCELRAARAIFAAKKLVRAIAVRAFEKIRERREADVASAAVVESPRAHEGEFGAME